MQILRITISMMRFEVSFHPMGKTENGPSTIKHRGTPDSMVPGDGEELVLSPVIHRNYLSQTFFMRTDPVGCSLKLTTFFRAGQITVECATEITGTSSKISCSASSYILARWF